MAEPNTTDLYQFLTDHFSNDELNTLCFNLFVEYEDLPGDGRAAKARELVKYMNRHGRLVHLRAALAEERPTAYQKKFRETPATPAVPVMPRRNPRQVFVSHAHQDAAFAQKLAADLRARGYPVWIAPDSIQLGEEWPEAINRGLEESGVVVVALTPHALGSEWVRKETNAAIVLEARKRIRFIPLDVADCDPPIIWSTYQFASFRTSYEAGLLALLNRLDGKQPAPVPPPPKTKPPANRFIHPKTGIELVRIPAGSFLFGSTDEDKDARDNEKPQRKIELPEFWIGLMPVTNDQFARFVTATAYKSTAEEKGQGGVWTGNKWEWVKGADWRHPGGPDSTIEGKGGHPVVQVSWLDAAVFCEWAGLQLATEQQWEKAARGDKDGRIWPWGNDQPTPSHANYDNFMGGTTPVGRYSPLGDSQYGCQDMVGNVWEWTDSWYDSDQTRRVLRGGSWVNYRRYARVALRSNGTPDNRDYVIGFRVAAPVVSGS